MGDLGLSVQPNSDGSDVPAAKPAKLQFLQSPSYTWTDVSQAISVANTAKTKYDATRASGGTRKENAENAKALFAACCELAERVAFVNNSSDQPVMTSADTLLQSSISKDPMPRVVGVLSGSRLQASSTQSGAGMCMTGTLISSTEIHGGVEHLVKLLGRPGFAEKQVFVIQASGTSEPVALPAPGSTVIVLGVLVKNPGAELASYESRGGPVVWGGRILPLSLQ